MTEFSNQDPSLTQTVPLVNPSEVLIPNGEPQVVQLGGSKKGGLIDLPLDELSPLIKKNEQGYPGDLLVMVRAGTRQFGLLDTEPELGTESIALTESSDRIRLVAFDTSTGEMKRDENGEIRSMGLNEPDTRVIIGRNKSSLGTEELLGLNNDQLLSGRHVSFLFTEENGIEVRDENSTNGTQITVRPKAEQVSPGPIESSKEVAESREVVGQEAASDLGKTAVEQAVELVDNKIGTSGTAREKDAHQSADQSEESDSEYAAERQAKAMTELREVWGWNESIDAPQAIAKLQSEQERIANLTGLLRRFDIPRKRAIQTLHQSDRDGGVQLNPREKEKLDEFIDGSDSLTLRSLAEIPRHDLPPAIRGKVDDFAKQLLALKTHYSNLTLQYTRNNPRLAKHEIDPVAKALVRELPAFSHHLRMADREIEDMLVRLRGYAAYAKDLEKKQGPESAYRNEQVAAWAQELSAKVSDERLSEIVDQMEVSIRIESGMVDDPNSPSRWFGDRVMANTEKQYRQPGQVDGKEVHMVTATQRLVAEMMATILSGQYDVKRSNDRTIEVHNHTVVRGQGRAAALAMIYGDSWQTKAAELGLEVTQV